MRWSPLLPRDCARKRWLHSFGGSISVGNVVDASAAIGVAQRKGLGNIRHLDTQSVWFQDAVHRRKVQRVRVTGTHNPADMLATYLDGNGINAMMGSFNVIPVLWRRLGFLVISPTDVTGGVDSDRCGFTTSSSLLYCRHHRGTVDYMLSLPKEALQLSAIARLHTLAGKSAVFA